jgi:hypothetical protein
LQAVIQVRDAHDAAERQRAVRRDRQPHVENFSVGRAPPVELHSVPGSDALLNK